MPSGLTNSDVIALCGLVVAFFAFVTTIWQGVVARRHNILSVKPVLDFYHHAVPEKISIVLKNHGVGVAFINSVHITNNGITHYFGRDALKEIAKRYPIDLPFFNFVEISPGTALAAGDELRLFAVDVEGVDEERVKGLRRMLGESRIYVKYESIYGKKDGATYLMDVM